MPVQEKIKEILNWSEKYTKTDMGYLTKGGIWLTLRRVIASASAFLLALVFANLLSKEVYGTYKYVLSTIGLLTGLTLSGMGTALTQAVARGYDRTLITSQAIKLKWNLIVSVISLGVAGYYFVQDNLSFAGIYALVAAVFPIWNASALWEDYFQGKTLFDKIAKFSILQRIILTGGLMAAAFFAPDNFFFLVTLWLLIQAVFAIVYYAKAKRMVDAKATTDPGADRYAKHLSVVNILATVSDNLDSILVFQYLGPAQLAIYSFAIAIPEEIKSVISNIGTLAFPKFAQKSLTQIKAGIKKRYVQLFFLGLAVAGLYILIAPWVYRTFFPEYQESILFSQIFILSMLNMTFSLSAVALQATKRVREQYVSSVVSNIFKIIAVVCFTFAWGLLGLVIARIIVRWGSSLLDALLLFRAKEERTID